MIDLPLKNTVRRQLFAAIGLLVLTAAIYAPVARHPFLRYDDDRYVTGNALVRRGLSAAGLAQALTYTAAANWHPVTWSSHMLDVQLFGLDAGAHHSVNLLLHLANTVLLLHLMRRLTGALWRSAFVAGLFAVHPLHVESVAWVAERKDVLAALFAFLTLLAYLRARARPGPLRSATVCVLYALGLAAKPMLVTLPFLLLLLDFWPLQRFGRDARGCGASAAALLREKAPLFLLSACSALLTFTVQARSGTVPDTLRLSLTARIGNALAAYVAYLADAVRPAALAAYYPHPGTGLPWQQVVLSALLLAGLTWGVFRARRRCPALATGWLWYLGSLVPVIGLVQAGEQARADRYTYLPLIGVFIMVAWGGALLVGARGRRRTLTAAACTAILALLAVLGRVQVGFWRDDETLWRHAIASTRDNWFAHNNLGSALFLRGRLDEAAAAFRECLRIVPRSAEAYNNLGTLAFYRSDFATAADHFRQAGRLLPTAIDPPLNLGLALERLGRRREAQEAYRTALGIDPSSARARQALDKRLFDEAR